MIIKNKIYFFNKLTLRIKRGKYMRASVFVCGFFSDTNELTYKRPVVLVL